MSIIPSSTTVLDELEEIFTLEATEEGWIVICWDDDFHTMNEVVVIFMLIFRKPEDWCMQRMGEVHFQGKSILAQGSREKMDHYRKQLESFDLKATVEQA